MVPSLQISLSCLRSFFRAGIHTGRHWASVAEQKTNNSAGHVRLPPAGMPHIRNVIGKLWDVFLTNPTSLYCHIPGLCYSCTLSSPCRNLSLWILTSFYQGGHCERLEEITLLSTTRTTMWPCVLETRQQPQSAA